MLVAHTADDNAYSQSEYGIVKSWILDNSDDNFQTAMPKIVVFFGFR